MELEVRLVGGIESCFVSLPLPLIHSLESTNGGFLPPVLALELRSPDGGCWNVAWSGSASNSQSIEVARQYAESISLPNHAKVKVKAVAKLPKAVAVTIEPNSEDDWEILELNSEVAEEVILKQVGIVHEGMMFPLWLHGHIVVEFLVVSTSPKKSIVQLVPGTEVAVVPKVREKRVDAHHGVPGQSTLKEQLRTKSLLRVQALNKDNVHRFKFRGIELGVLFNTAAFVHPETAHKSSFDNLQLVTILPRLSSEILQDGKDVSQRKGSNSVDMEGNNGVFANSTEPRWTVVRILFSDAVAKGHVMLPQSLRLFIRARVHSWVYLKKLCVNLKKDISFMALSPCHFKLFGKNRVNNNPGIDVLESYTNHKHRSIRSNADMFPSNATDWLQHDELLASFSQGCFINGSEKGASEYNATHEKKLLIQSWVTGQLKAVASYTGQMDVTSVILANETLFHFEMIENKSGNNIQEELSNNGSLKKRNCAKDSATELLYLLTATFDESSQHNQHDYFELSLNTNEELGSDLQEMELPLGKLKLVDPVTLDSIAENSFDVNSSLTLASLSWMETAISDIIKRLFVLLSLSSGKLLNTFDLPFPGHVLIYGPPGSGKTTLTMAVAKHLEEHNEILAHIIFVSCSKLALEKSQAVRQAVTSYVSEAMVHAPSLIIFDDLDNIISSPSEVEGSQPPRSAGTLLNVFMDIMDEYGEKRQSSCGYGPIAFMATVQSLGNLPHSLSSSGRFDFHVQLPAPAASERGAILKHEIHKRTLQCSEDILSEVASRCDGYDAYDLEILVDRAVHAAISRFLPSHILDHEKPILVREDFSQAMHDFVPVAMRGVTKAASDGMHSGWEDVGGLIDIRNAIQEMVELPSKFSGIFAQSPLRLRSNVLLYGPPGCGKTHIVGAAAAACSLRFISVKGPELLNKYIGASEQAVRDLFSKAAAAAPCLLFFDEFDSIAPKRGHDNTGVTDRVVNQLLTELDGVEALTGVFVFAATSRPDLLDAALLRPGRLDRLLFCDFPSWRERLDILTVLSRKLPLESNVNLETIASMTEGFSGADLQALLSDAQLASVHELLDSGDSGTLGRKPVISDELLKSVASKARPSVSEAEKHRLNGIYSQFLDSKKSVTAQSRDAKGKRATLA